MLRASNIAKLKSDDCDLYKEEGKARVSHGGIMPYSSFVATLSRILAGRIREADEKVAKALLADLSKGFDSDLYKKAKNLVIPYGDSLHSPSGNGSAYYVKTKDVLANLMEQIVIYTSYYNCFVLRYSDTMLGIDNKRKVTENSCNFVKWNTPFYLSSRLVIATAMNYMWDTIIPNVDFSVEDRNNKPSNGVSHLTSIHDIFVPIGRGEVGGRAMVYDKPSFNDDGSIQVCPKGMEESYAPSSRLMNVNVGMDSDGNIYKCLEMLYNVFDHLVRTKNAYIYVGGYKSDASRIDDMTYEELVSLFDLENGMGRLDGLSREYLDALDGCLDSFKAKEHLTRKDLLKYVKFLQEGFPHPYVPFTTRFGNTYISAPLLPSVKLEKTPNAHLYINEISEYLWDIESQKGRLTPIYVNKHHVEGDDITYGRIFRKLQENIKVLNQSDINQFRIRMEDEIEKGLGIAGDYSFVELLDDVYGLNLGNYKRYIGFIGFALFELKHRIIGISPYELRDNNGLHLLGAHAPMVSYLDCR